jgi:hypothetical protein
VAMQMVGHKTESIYRRYAIVSEGDRQDAAEKLAVLHKREAKGSRTVLPLAEVKSREKIKTRTASGKVSGKSAGDTAGAMMQGRG